MYRDAASALDEHDRAVGAILIGETLVAQCERAVERIRNPHATERWGAMRDLHDDYAEIWRQLDRARHELSLRGVNTTGYEELRPQVKPTISAPSAPSAAPSAAARARADRDQAIDLEALEDARRAIAELKLAVPGADWKAIARRTHELVEIPALRRRHRLAVTGVVAGVMCGLTMLILGAMPAPKKDPGLEMRREISTIAQQRKVKLHYLALAIDHGEPSCDRPIAHDYVKLLVMDGRGDDAEAFADRYLGRCGEDTVVENWANAPRPPR